MNYQTNEQLSELRLNAMKIEYQRQSELPAVSELTFDERFSMIVTAQINARRDAKMKRLIRAADLREPGASLSSIDYDPVRNLPRKDVTNINGIPHLRGSDSLPRPSTQVPPETRITSNHYFKRITLCLNQETIYPVPPFM